MFSLLLAVIDLDNFEYSDVEKTRSAKSEVSYPAMEYRYIGKFLSHFNTVIRMAVGDFNFDSSNKLTWKDQIIYWILWYIIVTITLIVFLNFIIAEVSASYQMVKDSIDVLCMKEKATLIQEAEQMLRARFGYKRLKNWTHLFPKYLICREQEN